MFNVINIIPTGIGANLGGFAGDANPVNSLLESICDNVITHPNAVNAASLYVATSKTLYVEGHALDLFIKGEINLKRKYNKIGVIIDKKAESKITHITNALNACRTVFGTDITEYIITDQEINPKVTLENRLFSGEVGNKETMFKAANKLIEKGANALAVFTVIDNPFEENDKDYLNGNGADPIGRVEAIISHLLVEETLLPCAHAPVFLEDYEKIIVDPRVASEEIGYTFIPCVIRGLQNAPQFIKSEKVKYNDYLSIENINAVVAPYSCMNGIWKKYCDLKNIPVIAVKENTTVLEDFPDKNDSNVMISDNYLETMGILLSLKNNISYKSLKRPVYKLNRS